MLLELISLLRFDKMGVLKTKIEDIPEVLPLKIKTIREQDESRQLTPDEMKQIQLDAENESKMNINKICLRFQAYEMKGDALVQIAGCKPVYSNVINDSKGPGAELKIFRLSTNESSVMGGQEVFVLVSKVSLASIKVKFFENYDNGDRLWEAYGTFVEVHRQFAIVLKTPPYRNPSISSRTKVQVQLVRVEADGVPESVSKPFDFFYNPKPQSVSTQTENPASNIQPEVSSACAIPVALNDPIDIQEVTSQAIEYPPATDQSQSSPSVHIFEQTFYNVNPESDQLLSGILAFYPTDMSPNLFQVLGSSPEELNRYLGEGDDDDDYGNSRMETDCRGRDANHNRKINFSLLSKLSALVKLFKKSYDDKELHEMLVDITSSHVRSNKKIFLSIIRHGSAADIRTLAVILINFKLLEFMTKSNEANQNVLHLLIKKRHGTLLKEFLDFFGTAKLQIDLNQVDVRGRTPLHVAISKGDEEAVRVLLCCHVDLSVADKKGFLPVHLAVSSSNLPILKLLVEAGADVEAQHLLTGDNVLHMAVQADKIFMDMLKYLIAQDEFLLQQINNLEMNVLQLAIFDEKPASLISFLSSFYDDLPLKSESSTGDERNEEDTSMFDIQCKQKLCGILDESGEWKNIVTLMALEDKIFDGQNEASPTNTLIKYFEVGRLLLG